MKIFYGLALVLALLAGALWWVADTAPGEPLGIDNARIRLVPGGAPMAGYFGLSNHSEATIRLVGVSSDAFEAAMIHRTTVEDGRARMRHVEGGVALTPGESVSFEPMGLHLMLMRAQRELQVGDEVDVVLRFEGIQPAERTVAFTVVPVTQS